VPKPEIDLLLGEIARFLTMRLSLHFEVKSGKITSNVAPT